MPMKNFINEKDGELLIKYSWKDKSWHSIEITAENERLKMETNAEFEFITEHYFGFTKKGNKTSEYEVCHPKWDYYFIKDYQLEIDFEKIYGKDFGFLNHQKPISIMLAEGSEIEVKTKKYLA